MALDPPPSSSEVPADEATPPGAKQFVELLGDAGRHIFVTQDRLDLRSLEKPNEVYVLELPNGSSSAQRGAGGVPRVVKAYHYRCGSGECIKVDETEDEERLENLDLPDHATISIVLPDGRERLVPGIADKELVRSYSEILD